MWCQKLLWLFPHSVLATVFKNSHIPENFDNHILPRDAKTAACEMELKIFFFFFENFY